MRRSRLFTFGFIGAVLVATAPAVAQEQKSLTLLAPVELVESGLLGHLAARFTAKTSIALRITGNKIGNFEKLVTLGEADVVLTNDPNTAARLAGTGEVLDRREIFYSERIIVGPKADPARITGMASVIAAFTAIAAKKHPFLSRYDKSAMHRTERALWREAGPDPEAAGDWYQKARKKMSLTLRLAVLEDAYTLTDRASWLRVGNAEKFAVHVEGDPRLLVQIAVMRLNPKRHRATPAREAREFLTWLASDAGREAFAAFAIGGEPVYYPNQEGGAD